MTSTDNWNAVMEAEDLPRGGERLHRAARVLQRARSGPITPRQHLSVFDSRDSLRIMQTALALKIGSEYREGDIDTAIQDALTRIVQLAEYAAVDFRECLRYGLWQYGCDLVDDGSRGSIPRDLIARSDELAGILAERGFRTSPGEISALAGRVDDGQVLELGPRELSLLQAIRQTVLDEAAAWKDGHPDAPVPGEG
jgi:hypothetical protein